ncbi:hypothetical protein AeNC1_013215 [Aphanomyces euteiches]|nr:hypothetical protein AeNC1_013215 [Aphanomyces euteiches]
MMADPKDKMNRVLETIRTLQSQSDDVKAAAEAMKEQVDVWKKAMAEWSELEHRIAENIANAPNMITLDVGGTLFKTSKDTLLRFEGGYFHALLGSGKWKPDSSNGAYTLDLNGGIPIQRVMDYLRSGQLSFSGLNDWEVQQTRSILDYLKISSMNGRGMAVFLLEILL